MEQAMRCPSKWFHSLDDDDSAVRYLGLECITNIILEEGEGVAVWWRSWWKERERERDGNQLKSNEKEHGNKHRAARNRRIIISLAFDSVSIIATSLLAKWQINTISHTHSRCCPPPNWIKLNRAGHKPDESNLMADERTDAARAGSRSHGESMSKSGISVRIDAGVWMDQAILIIAT